MFSPLEIINKKKRKIELNEDEIKYMINGYIHNHIPDYQMSAFLMAIYFTNMTSNEVSSLTKCMIESGDTIDLSYFNDVVVDKHSTGGVGDKVSIITVPLVASLNIPVVKMSGRGLGHTGGTIDKLESIQGFNTELSEETLLTNIKKYNMALVAQTGNLAPADKKIYALRDVTGTVDSLPLIASSIMSKKLATGVDGIVLDVKVGDGAFMKTLHDARKLARLMIDIGKNLGKQVVALLTPMDQPLGKEIGNLNEVQEAVRLLKNEKYDKQLMEVSLEVAAQMVSMSTHFKNKNIEEIKAKLRTQIVNGKAYEKFCELVEIQGGETDTIFTQYATNEYVIKSKENGYIEKIKTEELGYIASQLGAGRKKKDDQIDHHAGVSIEVKLGDFVRKGQVLLRARTNKVYEKELEVRMQRAVVMNDKKRTRIVSPILDIIQ